MSNAVAIAQYGSNNPAWRNRIINGDMRIDQRNNGASVTPTASTYTLDRWTTLLSQPSKFSVQQNAGSVTPPAGFTNYLGVTSLSAYSVLTGDYFAVVQNIEGFNVADLGWGSASAASVTVSFWVRSSLTGTQSFVLRNAASNRSYPATYTINAANTWEQKSVTIAGDTTGTWGTGNGTGIQVWFNLGAGASFSGTANAWAGSNITAATGSTSVVGTNGATFYITGVQLEAGTNETPFERRAYGTELQLCQRYYEFGGVYIQAATSAGSVVGGTAFYRATKRASPTVTLSAVNGTSLTQITGVFSDLTNQFAYYTVPNGNGQSSCNWTSSAEL